LRCGLAHSGSSLTAHEGSLNLNELIPTDGLQARVDAGNSKSGELTDKRRLLVSGLSSFEQKNPGNVAKYETANRALARAGQFLSSMDGALNDDSTHRAIFLDKAADMWNFIVGTQYQHNRHWMIRLNMDFLDQNTDHNRSSVQIWIVNRIRKYPNSSRCRNKE